MPRTALVTGVGGQDGVLLARRLLADGHRVVGTVRPGAPLRLGPYLSGVDVTPLDVADTDTFAALVREHRPAEIYHLAGLTSVGRSWDDSSAVAEVNGAAVERMLEVLLALPGERPRFLQASSAEVFGPDAVGPQDESAPHRPVSPYAQAKSRAHLATVAAREAGLHACVAILYNHESPLRGPRFVTRKISRAVAEIAAGHRDTVQLGNLDVARDWGAAHEYVAGMSALLGHDEPIDLVLATGRQQTLRDLVEVAFERAGVPDPWSRVTTDPALVRPVDAAGPVGDPRRAADVLGWRARCSFERLVAWMVDVDLKRVASGVEETPEYLNAVLT